MSSLSICAQLDSQENSTTIAAEKDKEVPNSSILVKSLVTEGLSDVNRDRVNGLSVPENANELDLPEEEFSMFGGEAFANPAELFKKQLKNNLRMDESLEVKQYGSTTNQYLGDFKTSSVFVNVVYRDHEYPDGDRIRVFVNDDVVESNILLGPSFQGFKLDLKKGFNKIDFQALNQGSSGPNTAELQVMDDAGNLVSSNRWNLATGVKATIILVKE